MLALGASPSPYWFVTRGTGALSLVLLTASMALGVANIRRTRIGDMPRFVLDSIHRSASLLAVAFLFVHIVTTLLDGFAPISVLDVVIPFHSAYRPIWLGLGAIAFDLMIAITITSLLRDRFGYRTWRITHWFAYACWPVALVHGLGTGSDTKAHWMMLLTGACVAVVLAAVVARVSSGWPANMPARLSAIGVAALLPIGLAVWLPGGPLGKNWALRSGTPPSVLAAAATQRGSGTATRPGGSAGQGSTGGAVSFTANAVGRVRQNELPGGRLQVSIALTLSGQRLNSLNFQLLGEAVPGGGVEMSTSSVSLGSSANPSQYRGQVTALEGSTIQAQVSDSSGTSLRVLARLNINAGPGSATGTVTVQPGTP